jgi:hypothetical protein
MFAVGLSSAQGQEWVVCQGEESEFQNLFDFELEEGFIDPIRPLTNESSEELLEDTEQNQDPKNKEAPKENKKSETADLAAQQEQSKQDLVKKLDLLVEKHISAICPCGFHDDDKNHCAHAVCHALDYQKGLFLCTQLVKPATKELQNKGAGIRVQEVFALCPKVGEGFCENIENLKPGLIFAISAGASVDVETKSMPNIPKKHIGIFVDNFVYHYSNSRKMWVKVPLEEFKIHYGEGTQIFWGEFLVPLSPKKNASKNETSEPKNQKK